MYPPNLRPVIRSLTSTARHPANFARLWVTLFALFAFTLQAYVVQSHIHAAAIGKQLPGKLPAGGDQANCPFCQAVVHAGHYLTPSAAGFVPPVVTVFGVFLATKIVSFAPAASHSWNSRAPPHA